MALSIENATLLTKVGGTNTSLSKTILSVAHYLEVTVGIASSITNELRMSASRTRQLLLFWGKDHSESTIQ